MTAKRPPERSFGRKTAARAEFWPQNGRQSAVLGAKHGRAPYPGGPGKPAQGCSLRGPSGRQGLGEAKTTTKLGRAPYGSKTAARTELWPQTGRQKIVDASRPPARRFEREAVTRTKFVAARELEIPDQNGCTARKRDTDRNSKCTACRRRNEKAAQTAQRVNMMHVVIGFYPREGRYFSVYIYMFLFIQL